jgi:hypothetical protein
LETRGDGPTTEVRSVQRMAGGVEVRVTQTRVDEAEREPIGVAAPETARAAADPAVATDAAESGNVASVRRDRYWLTVVGALPAEALQVLAAGARAVDWPESRDPR